VFHLTVQAILNLFSCLIVQLFSCSTVQLFNCSAVQTIPNLFNALCHEAAAVENVLDVGQPAGDGQATHPLVVGGGHVTASLHQLRVGILKKVSWLKSWVRQIESRKHILQLH